MDKIRTLPVGILVAIIIGVAALTGGVAFAVYKTFIEPLSVEQTRSITDGNKRMATFALEGCPSSDGVSQKEVTSVVNINSGISDEDAKKYVVARCEQNAVIKYAHDAVAARGIARYDSSILSTQLPVRMPAVEANVMKVDIGTRVVTKNTLFYKDGQQVDRNKVPEGSLVHVVYDGVRAFEDGEAGDKVLAVIVASVDMKYFMALYELGSLIQRVPCRNNTSESCLSDLPGMTFYTALSGDTGPVGPKEKRYVDAITHKTFIELGGVITHIDGNAFVFRTSSGRSVTFHVPDGWTERARKSDTPIPGKGSEIIVTTIGADRETISSSDLLSAWTPIIPE
jgi:hypothetical protein